jgi:hypothetical protein
VVPFIATVAADHESVLLIRLFAQAVEPRRFMGRAKYLKLHALEAGLGSNFHMQFLGQGALRMESHITSSVATLNTNPVNLAT